MYTEMRGKADGLELLSNEPLGCGASRTWSLGVGPAFAALTAFDLCNQIARLMEPQIARLGLVQPDCTAEHVTRTQSRDSEYGMFWGSVVTGSPNLPARFD